MRQRIGKLVTLTLSLGLVIVSATSLYVNQLSKQTAESLLSAKDAELALSIRKLKASEDLLAQKQSKIDTQTAQLSKANQELTAKLKELETANKKIKAQESQITSNASELSKLRNRPPLFNFNVTATKLQNAEVKKADIEKLVTDAYDVIVDIYGLPYLLSSVTIQLVDSLNNPQAAAETQISNGPEGLALIVRLTDFDKTKFNDLSSLIHELIHTFHGLATLTPVAYEEGITVAATDAVFKRLIQLGKVPNFNPLYIRTSSHGYSASPISIPADDNAFYASKDVADYYQLAGYGWFQLYESDNHFFKKFNEEVYTLKRNGIDITSALVLDTIEKTATNSVDDQTVSNWLKTRAFNLN